MTRRRGFTLVELVVVIAVIAILATLATVGMSRYLADSRDSQRAANVSAIAEALEKYYDANGEYPSCSAITADGSTVANNTLKGVTQSALVVPGANGSTTNSIECGVTLTTKGTDFIQYVGDGSDACNTSGSCLNYSLRYREESSGTIKTQESRHNTSIATSGAPTISVTNTDYDNIDLSWTAVANASSYLVQRSSSSNFSSVTEYPINSTATTTTVTGLTQNTTYYFRVKAGSTGSTGNWSNTISATTISISNPVITCTTNSTTQITVNWGAVSGATSYTLAYANNSGFTSPTTLSGLTGTSRAVTGLTVGVTYYFHMKAVNSSVSSNWSTAKSCATTVPAPTCISDTVDSSTQVTVSWCSVGVATTYTVEYSTTSDFSSGVSSVSGISSAYTSKAVTGLNQGTTYYFRVYALLGATSSVASTTASGTTTVNTPGAPSMTVVQHGGARACSASYWVYHVAGCSSSYYSSGHVTSASCPSGTSAVMELQARYNSPTTKHSSGSTTVSTWYITDAASPYYVLWSARYYCKGPNANSSWGAWSAEKS